MKKALAILIVLLTPAFCLAQDAKKIPVAVQHTGKDQVGQSYAFALKEAIRGSQSFKLVEHDISPPTPRIVVRIVSLEYEEATGIGKPGTMSAIAESIVYDSAATSVAGAFIHHQVQLCGSLRVDSCAKKTLPFIDQAVEVLRKYYPSLWRTL